jgi:hypothetical protein
MKTIKYLEEDPDRGALDKAEYNILTFFNQVAIKLHGVILKYRRKG